MTKNLAHIVLRISSALLIAYFGVNVLWESVRDQNADFLEALHLTGMVSAVVGGAAALVALYFVYLLVTDHTSLGFVSQISLGFVMLFAGVAKIFEPGGARESILGYRLGLSNSVASFLGYAMPIVEIGLGFMLLTGLWMRFAAVASAAMMVVFIIAIVQVWARGYSIDCGCFGSGGGLDPDGRHLRYSLEVLRDLIFTGMGAFLALSRVTPFTLAPNDK